MTNKTKRAESMERLRRERKEAGLVEFRAWVTPATKGRLRELAEKAKSYP